MSSDKATTRTSERQQAWEAIYAKAIAKHPERLSQFTTVSNEPIKKLYTPEDLQGFDYDRDLGNPAQYPYTRGVQPTMYRGRLWTMRQFAGLGGAEDTNARFHYLMDHGETGLSTAFDMPTLMGYDSDSHMARGEVGKCGVAIDTLADMEILFDKIPLDQVTTSMTINPPASIMLAMYVAVAEKQGVGKDKIGGTIQNDMLKEFIAQKTFMLPPEPSMRIIADTVEYCTNEVPRWNTISISGYHIREAGSTAAQELAFTLADGIGYVQACIDRGLDVDAFAPRLSFFFNAHVDFFEEIAKYRAARRIWARVMKERFKAKDPRSLLLRFHTQTAGCSLTAQQPYNNVVRTAYQGLSAVLGGTQSLHTNSLDEVLALPTEHAVTIALRTQQIIGEEIGVTNTIDPLAGSYFVESLTNKMEQLAMDYINKIDDMGGILKAIEVGFPQKEIADAAYTYQKQIDDGEKIVVGVNKYQMEENLPIELLRIDPVVEKRQLRRLEKVKSERDNAKVQTCLQAIEAASRNGENLMPHLVEAVKSYVTQQEICDTWRNVFGRYTDPGMF
ncbi:MAG: methylmalonyl-CoA mutase family protein [Deltaproteobacteria bacterium]|nr:methylmalonyl-CoA mutase family protein [Candidatus Anaeroferrophillus wilburensis]MBN2888327.1 methylmalonyl-CoA mutase family protein [Deltaproteobacteria bacterium]